MTIARRHADELINKSRRDHIRSELETCSDPRQRWTVAKRLLHADNRPTNQTRTTDDIALCEQLSDFFSSKFEQLRHSIVCKLSDSPFSQQLPPEPIHAGLQLGTLPPVTASEVSKLLTSIPSKTYILYTYISTQIIPPHFF